RYHGTSETGSASCASVSRVYDPSNRHHTRHCGTQIIMRVTRRKSARQWAVNSRLCPTCVLYCAKELNDLNAIRMRLERDSELSLGVLCTVRTGAAPRVGRTLEKRNG